MDVTLIIYQKLVQTHLLTNGIGLVIQNSSVGRGMDKEVHPVLSA